MDAVTAGLIVAVAGIGVTVLINLFGGGWKLSGRLSKVEGSGDRLEAIEETLKGVQAELKTLTEILIKIAEMRGEYALLDQRITNAEQRQAATDKLIDDLRRGQGWITGPRRQSVEGRYPAP